VRAAGDGGACPALALVHLQRRSVISCTSRQLFTSSRERPARHITLACRRLLFFPIPHFDGQLWLVFVAFRYPESSPLHTANFLVSLPSSVRDIRSQSRPIDTPHTHNGAQLTERRRALDLEHRALPSSRPRWRSDAGKARTGRDACRRQRRLWPRHRY
jgi:hypothetical protein